MNVNLRFLKCLKISAQQMDELTVSSAVSRLTSDTYNVNQMLARVQRMGVRAPILLLGGSFMMLRLDVPLALILASLLPVICAVVVIVSRWSVPLYLRQQEMLDETVQTVQENVTGVRVIKALSKTEYEKERFHRVNDALTAVDRRAGSVTAITNPFASMVLNLGLTLVLVAGAWRVSSGACKSGVIIAFMQYFIMILNAMLSVTRIFIMCTKAESSARRVAQVLRMPRDLAPIEDAGTEDADPPHIEFRHVSFAYPGSGTCLSDLSFTLGHGQTLGILGPTGSGKSTMVSLLLRFYDPDEGQILLDGRDLRTIPPEELRSRFGTVLQNDFLMEGSISDNIRFFREVSPEHLRAAADDAQAEFIASCEGGMEGEVLVRGTNLSGGQKQRLLISRALADDPEILILDDASSALDYRTDALLRRSLRRNHRHTTTVLVAQRISSLRHADRILVLEDGALIGSGTHEELMRSCAEYRIIACAQMGDGMEAQP